MTAGQGLPQSELLPDPAESGAESRATRWYFGFFLASGFCGLVYQVTWLRLAMASFGVNAPIAAIVISLFMAGLGLGSVAGGKLIGRIRLPEVCANICFGGPKRNRLFMTASQSLYAVYVETQGAHIT